MSVNKIFKKNEKKGMTALAFCQFSGILKANGCGSPEPVAAVAPVKGGDSQTTIYDDFYFESVGRCICTGVTTGTSSTPAGSFFVPDVEVGGKSNKLTSRRLKCVNAPTTDTPSAKDKERILQDSYNYPLIFWRNSAILCTTSFKTQKATDAVTRLAATTQKIFTSIFGLEMVVPAMVWRTAAFRVLNISKPFLLSSKATKSTFTDLESRRSEPWNAQLSHSVPSPTPSTTDVTTIPHVFPVRWRPG